MPHFSKGTHEFLNGMQQGKQYRITAWINIPTRYDETTKRYDPLTPEQQAARERLYQAMKDAGAGISITVSERTDDPDVKNFPAVSKFNLFVNNYDNYQGSNQQSNYQAPQQQQQQQQPQQPPAAPTGGFSFA